jgi:hypothetical protein
LEAFKLGTGELGFKLLNTMLREGECVNRAASHQKQGGNQNPETNAKRRFHNYTSTLRRR